MVMSYERVQIGKRFYLVCAECRRVHEKGFRPCYLVPQPGQPSPPPETKQSLCRVCYLEQWKRINPDEEIPDLKGKGGDRLEDYPDPVSFNEKFLRPVYKTEFDIWEDAILTAQGSGGVETVTQAFARLSGIYAPDMELTGPPDETPGLISQMEDFREQNEDKGRRSS